MIEKTKPVIRIDRIADQFEVWLDESFPFHKLKIKVLERTSGDFLAVPNLNVLDILSHEPVYVSGLGGSVQEALDDLLTRFISDVKENTPPDGLTEAHFVSSANEDF